MNLAFQQHSFAMGCAVEYGPEVYKRIGNLIQEYGCRRIFLVTDENLVRVGLSKKVNEPIKEQGADIVVFDKIMTEPTDTFVHEGAKSLKDSNADMVVALGGGSVMDAAKCIAAMVVNPGSIVDYEGVENKFENRRTQPLVTMPTTSGSGAEIAGWAVITDTSRSYKMSIGSEYLTPDVALVDPVLTLDLPPRQTAYSGFDALSQAIEGMISRRRTPITLGLGMHAVKLIAKNLPRAVSRGWDLEARSNMSIGSLMAGMVINISGCVAVHSLAETLGGFYHIPHGLAVGLCLPHVLKYNMPGDYDLLAEIAQALGENTSDKSVRDAASICIRSLYQMLDDLDFPTLKDVGLKEEDIPKIAQLAVDNACTADNPCEPSPEDFETMLRSAYFNEREF